MRSLGNEHRFRRQGVRKHSHHTHCRFLVVFPAFFSPPSAILMMMTMMTLMIFFCVCVYVTKEGELFLQSLSKAISLSYAAGSADVDSVQNFGKEDTNNTNQNSNLEQARQAIVEAKTSLDKIISVLISSTST
jgi:hypothetical protein